MIGDEYKNLPPEERERIAKEKNLRSHYIVDVKPGDLVKYRFGGVEFIGLVEDVDEVLSPSHGDLPGVKKKYAKVIWSSQAPDKSVSNKTHWEEETSWYELNRICWSVANR